MRNTFLEKSPFEFCILSIAIKYEMGKWWQKSYPSPDKSLIWESDWYANCSYQHFTENSHKHTSSNFFQIFASSSRWVEWVLRSKASQLFLSATSGYLIIIGWGWERVCVICRSCRRRQIAPTEALDNSRHHAKTKFHNYFIIHLRFIPTLYKFSYFNKMLELLYLISKMLFPLLLASAHYS